MVHDGSTVPDTPRFRPLERSGSSLERRQPRRAARGRILIGCSPPLTAYFESLARHCRLHEHLTIFPLPAGEPMAIIKKGMTAFRRRGPFQRFYIIADLADDADRTNIAEARNHFLADISRGNAFFRLIPASRAFDLWLLLHREDPPAVAKKKVLIPPALETHLQPVRASLSELKAADLEELLDDGLANAIRRGRKLTLRFTGKKSPFPPIADFIELSVFLLKLGKRPLFPPPEPLRPLPCRHPLRSSDFFSAASTTHPGPVMKEFPCQPFEQEEKIPSILPDASGMPGRKKGRGEIFFAKKAHFFLKGILPMPIN